MQYLNESILFLLAAVPGILVFVLLEKSIKTISKFLKVLYLILAVICAVVATEASLWIVMEAEDQFTIILMRVMQVGICLVGLLMAGLIIVRTKTPTH